MLRQRHGPLILVRRPGGEDLGGANQGMSIRRTGPRSRPAAIRRPQGPGPAAWRGRRRCNPTILRLVGAVVPMGFRGEEGGVGLDHDPVVRDQVARPGDFRGIREGDDAGEGDPPTEVEHRPGVGFVAREAVEDEAVVGQGWTRRSTGRRSSNAFRQWIDHRFRKPLGRPGLDLGELFLEDRALEAAIGLVVVVIEPEFAPGHALRMPGRESASRPSRSGDRCRADGSPRRTRSLDECRRAR